MHELNKEQLQKIMAILSMDAYEFYKTQNREIVHKSFTFIDGVNVMGGNVSINLDTHYSDDYVYSDDYERTMENGTTYYKSVEVYVDGERIVYDLTPYTIHTDCFGNTTVLCKFKDDEIIEDFTKEDTPEDSFPLRSFDRYSTDFKPLVDTFSVLPLFLIEMINPMNLEWSFRARHEYVEGKEDD